MTACDRSESTPAAAQPEASSQPKEPAKVEPPIAADAATPGPFVSARAAPDENELLRFETANDCDEPITLYVDLQSAKERGDDVPALALAPGEKREVVITANEALMKINTEGSDRYNLKAWPDEPNQSVTWSCDGEISRVTVGSGTPGGVSPS